MDVQTLLKALAEQGPLAVIFVVLLILFYKLIWRVWSAALLSKDEEINRLLVLQEKLLTKVFPKENSPVSSDSSNSSNESLVEQTGVEGQ